MAKDAAELLRDALALSPEGRAALADSLLESLDDAIDDDAEEAWRLEIQRRLAEIESGSVDMIPWEEAERRLAARLQGK
jgi:putative addiction module component (TIGR02574 family)